MSIDAIIIRVSTSSILDVWAHDALCQAGEFVELGGIELILMAILTVVPILTPPRAQIKSYARTSSALIVLSKNVRKECMTHVWQGRGFKVRTYSAASFLLPLTFFLGAISVHSSSISLSFPPTREKFASREKGAGIFFFFALPGANPEARSDLPLN